MNEVKPIIKHGWLRAILFALTFLVLIIFSNFVIDKFLSRYASPGNDTAEGNSLAGLFLLTRASVSLGVAVISVYFFRRLLDKKDLISLGLTLKDSFSHAATGFFLGLLLLGLGTFFLIANKNLQWTNININSGQILLGLAIMMMVAFAEEFVFRGYMLNNLMSSMNKWLALVYSALLFALFHFSNPGISVLSLVNVFLAGLLLGINYIFTKNLWFGILFHFAWNFYQGSVLGYKVSGVPLKSIFEQQLTGNQLVTGEPFGFEGSALATILTLLSTLLLAWVYRKRFEM